jgi:hypothetical protein
VPHLLPALYVKPAAEQKPEVENEDFFGKIASYLNPTSYVGK